jgi:hypothetical protein
MLRIRTTISLDVRIFEAVQQRAAAASVPGMTT